MRKMALVMAVAVLTGTPAVRAHDEGHGPKLTDTAKQGGVVAPVIDKTEIKKGAKAQVVYKAELVRYEDGTVSVYIYDKAMKPLDLSGFDKTASGVIEARKMGKYIKTPFTLTMADGAFSGMAPKPSRKPFNFDLTLKQGNRLLLVAFDNLD